MVILHGGTSLQINQKLQKRATRIVFNENMTSFKAFFVIFK